MVPCNIEGSVPGTDAAIQTTHLFEDDRQSIAGDCIQEHKLACTKNEKGTKDHSPTTSKMATKILQSQ